MAFGGPTVGEQRATAQLNNNLENIAGNLVTLTKAIQSFTTAVEAHTKELQELTKSITPGWVISDDHLK